MIFAIFRPWAKKLSGKTIFHPIACQFCRPQCCDLRPPERAFGAAALPLRVRHRLLSSLVFAALYSGYGSPQPHTAAEPRGCSSLWPRLIF